MVSPAFDPEREQARGTALRAADLDAFRRHGVTPRALVRMGGWMRYGCSVVMRDEVLFRPRQRFAFARDEGGAGPGVVSAYTLVARDLAGDASDVVAWHPRTGRLATWLGRASLLGEEHVWTCTDEPLAVHRDPGGYLAAGWHGVVVVHETAARRLLIDADRRLQAEDLAHGEQLEAMLARGLPTIVVPEPSIEVAA